MIHLGQATAFTGIAFSLFMANAMAREVHTKITWSELPSAAGSRILSIMLPDGALLEGTLAMVNDNALILRVRKSSVPGYRPGQQVSVPRTAVRVVQARETKGPWRAIAAAIGAAGGAIAGWALAEGVFHTSGEGQGVWREPEGLLCVFVGGTGGAAAGYRTGSKADRDLVYFDIID